MTDASIGVDSADGTADGGTATTPRSDGAVVSVYVPEQDGWSQYRLTPDSQLTVDGPDGKPRAVIMTDPETDS